jgi:hypothetical protein
MAEESGHFAVWPVTAASTVAANIETLLRAAPPVCVHELQVLAS